MNQTPSSRVRVLACALFLQLLASTSAAAQQPSLTIEKLVTDGWDVVGYIAATDRRSLILFKHKERKHLVQCSVLFDVTRSPNLAIYCYELR